MRKPVALLAIASLLCIGVPCFAQEGRVSKWTDPVDGLQFRASVLKQKIFRDEGKLEVLMEISNVGEKDVYVLDPRKLTWGEAFYVFRPPREVGGNRFYFGIPELEMMLKAEWYTLIKKGETIGGNVLYRINPDAPAGPQEITFKVSMWAPRDNEDLRQWKKEDVQRIVPKLWTHGDNPPVVGPVSFELVDRPIEWHIQQLREKSRPVDKRVMSTAKALPKEKRLQILADLEDCLAKGVHRDLVFDAIAASRMPEGVDYLVGIGTGAAADADWRQYNDAYYLAITITKVLSEHPEEGAIPFLIEMTGHRGPRHHALKGLAELSRPEFFGIFCRFLLDPDFEYYERGTAAKGLARLSDPKAYEILHQSLELYGNTDEPFPPYIAEAYDELTQNIRKTKPDFQPPDFVENDKHIIKQRLQKRLDKKRAEKKAALKELEREAKSETGPAEKLPDAVPAKRPEPVADGEKYITDEFALAIPRGWRDIKDLAFGKRKLYLNGDGIGAPALDETGSPLQIGMMVEKFPGRKDSLDEQVAALVAEAKTAPRLALLGEADVEPYTLNDGTEARLILTEFIKERHRRSLHMKLVAKDPDSNGWVVSAWIVGGKESKIPTKASELAQKMRSHVVSFCFDKAKLAEPQAGDEGTE